MSDETPIPRTDAYPQGYVDVLNKEIAVLRAQVESLTKERDELKIANEAFWKQNLRAENDQLRAKVAALERQTAMDTECIERIRTVGMTAELERDALAALCLERGKALEEICKTLDHEVEMHGQQKFGTNWTVYGVALGPVLALTPPDAAKKYVRREVLEQAERVLRDVHAEYPQVQECTDALNAARAELERQP